MDLTQRCRQIELILSDVDGVLTDGRIMLDGRGVEAKGFFIRDGLGIRLWQQLGGRFGLISLRNSSMVQQRAAELGIQIVCQGVADKQAALEKILQQHGLTPEKTCYLGDDLPDLPVIRRVGLGVAVADACPEVREAAHHITAAAGGAGAVRETIEWILKAQSRWDDAIEAYQR